MTKLAWGVLLLALFAVQDDLSKIVTGADKGRKTTRKLTADQAKAIAASTGSKVEEVETSLAVLEGLGPIPELSERGRVVATNISAATPKGPVKLAVAVAVESDCVIAVKVLENKGDKAAESRLFLEQFEGYAWTDAIRKPPADLKAALDKAKAGEAAALVDFCVKMRRMETLWEELDEKPDVKVAEELAKIFDELGPRTADCGFLNARQRDTLKADLAKSARLVREWIAVMKDADAAKKVRTDIVMMCTRCHSSLPSRFRDARARIGLGNGWFSPGFDLIVPAEGPREVYDALARAIHRAALQLRDAK